MTAWVLPLITFLMVVQAPLPQQVSHSGRGAYEASLVLDAEARAVAWYDTRDGHGETYLRRLDADGHPDGGELRLTRGVESAFEPELTAFGDSLAVAWYDKHPETGLMRAHVARVGAAGEVAWRLRLSTAGVSGRNPVVGPSTRACSACGSKRVPTSVPRSGTPGSNVTGGCRNLPAAWPRPAGPPGR